MTECKVLVNVTVQVERTCYGDDRPMTEVFRAVGQDAVNQVVRELGVVAKLIGRPTVEAILTEAKEISP